MISPDLLAVVRCPLTLQPLRMADAALLAKLPAGTEAALVREDGAVAYPIRNGIPLLIPEEAMPVPAAAP